MEVAEEGVKFEEELRVRDGAAGYWSIVGRVSGLVRSRARDVFPSNANNSMKEL